MHYHINSGVDTSFNNKIIGGIIALAGISLIALPALARIPSDNIQQIPKVLSGQANNQGSSDTNKNTIEQDKPAPSNSGANDVQSTEAPTPASPEPAPQPDSPAIITGGRGSGEAILPTQLEETTGEPQAFK